MEGNKRVSGKRASVAKHDLYRVGTRHRQAKLVFRRMSGEGLRVEAKEGAGIKRISVRLKMSRDVVV